MQIAATPSLQIVLAEDNPADVQLVHMALRDAGLVCARRFVREGDDILKKQRSNDRHGQTAFSLMTASDASHDQEIAEKHAALRCFRKLSGLNEFVQLGAIAHDILSGTKSSEEMEKRRKRQ